MLHTDGTLHEVIDAMNTEEIALGQRVEVPSDPVLDLADQHAKMSLDDSCVHIHD